MTDAADAIRARRTLCNRLIAAHQAARLKAFFAPEAQVIAGDGTAILGAAAIAEAFAAQFADPLFVAYERMPEAVTPDAAGRRAAERGRWVGTWKAPGAARLSGEYLAVWRLAGGQWVIEAELYVTLAEG